LHVKANETFETGRRAGKSHVEHGSRQLIISAG